MWNIDILSDVFDQYTEEMGNGLQIYCSHFFDNYKKVLFESLKLVSPKKVSGIILGGFYVNTNNLSSCANMLDSKLNTFNIPESSTLALEMVKRLIRVWEKNNNILWLNIPFVYQHEEDDEMCEKSVSAFKKVLDVVFNNILLVHNRKYTSPVAVLNYTSNTASKVIESLETTSGKDKRPNFIFMRSVHPKFIVDCDRILIDSKSQWEIFGMFKQKFQALDYFDQIVCLFKIIVRRFEEEETVIQQSPTETQQEQAPTTSNV